MKADYGIDAPGVIRNLLLVAAAGLVAAIAKAAGWSGVVTFGSVRLGLAPMLIFPAIGCGAMALWMLYDSKIGKVRERERLLDHVDWRGDERVLDVGCGRGLMLIGAARRLTRGGRAVGIDIWQAEDLSGNRAEATLENAEREGVRDRVEVETADMRKLPFDDASFDVVVSCAAIHNLYDAAERAQAIREVARVLRPGGRAIIDDIRHAAEYTRAFGEHGLSVRRSGSRIASAFFAVVTFGSLRPATLIATRG